MEDAPKHVVDAVVVLLEPYTGGQINRAVVNIMVKQFQLQGSNGTVTTTPVVAKTTVTRKKTRAPYRSRWVGAKEAAAIVGVTAHTILVWGRSGRLQSKKKSAKRFVFNRADAHSLAGERQAV